MTMGGVESSDVRGLILYLWIRVALTLLGGSLCYKVSIDGCAKGYNYPDLEYGH